MPIGDVEVPVIGNNLMIPLLVVPHILIASYIIGINLIAATSELVGMITKQRRYDRFARNAAKTRPTESLTSAPPMRITSAFGSGMNRQAILRRCEQRPAARPLRRR